MKKLLLLFVFASAVSQPQSLNELYAKSLKAYKHNQYELYLTYAKQLDSIRPWHPAYTYNLASAYALNQKPQQAIGVLKKVILMNSATAFEEDADFVSLRELPDYKNLPELKAAVEKPEATSKKVVTLSERVLHPEGLCYLAKKKQWLTGSIRKGKIVSFDIKSGKCTDWLDTDYPVFAMKPDANEKYLWVATSALDEMEGYNRGLDGKGEILKVNIKTKTIEKRYTVGGKHTYGDLIVAKSGVVYVSDSHNPTIYKIEDDAMVPWISINLPVYNLQGLCFNGDESYIYLADYFNGIAEIQVADPAKRHWLTFPENTIQKGIDGLVWYDNSLIAIHNGVKPIRVIRYFLDRSGNISNYKVIDNNRLEFNEPTLSYIANDKCYFFANCPWPAYNGKRQLDESKVASPALFAFQLK
jgi:hypothetical protein